jgi:hypothetical protein
MFGGFYGEDRDLDEFCSAKVGENWNTAGILMDHDLPTRSCGARDLFHWFLVEPELPKTMGKSAP